MSERGWEAAKPRVLFHTAAGGRYGMGHLRRCLAVAREGRDLFVSFIRVVKWEGAKVSGALARAVGGTVGETAGGTAGQTVGSVVRGAAGRAGRGAGVRTGSRGDEGNGVSVPGLIGPDDTVPEVALVVSDLRDTGLRETARLARLGPVLSLDDLGRGARRAAVTVRSLTEGSLGLAPPSANFSGPAYLVLGGDAPRKRPRDFREKKGVLVSFGGSDPHDLTGKVVAALARIGVEARVVKGPLFTKPFGRAAGPGVEVVESPPDLADLIDSSRVLITSFGITMFEAFALGTPVILYNRSPYHHRLARGLPAVSLGHRRSVRGGRLGDAVGRALGDAEALLKNAEAAKSLVDGLGASRLAGLVRRAASGRRKDCLFRHGDYRALRRDGERTVFRCRKCGDLFLFDAGERVCSYDSPEYFTEEYRRLYGRTYLEDRDAITAAALKRIERIERVRGGRGRLLDVGCALGFFLEAARGRGWETKGIEVSGYASDWGAKNLSLDITKGSFLDVDIPAGAFDAITFFYVAEHFADIERVMEKASRALRRGGVLALALPNRSGVSFRLDREGYLDRRPVDHFFDTCPKNLSRFLENFRIIKRSVVATGVHHERFFGRVGLRNPPGFLKSAYCLAARSLLLGDTFEYYGIKV